MKKMICSAMVVVAGLAAMPASAVEVGLLLDRQMGKAQTASSAITGSTSTSFEGVTLNSAGIRVGVPLLDLGPASIQLSGTYHPQVRSDFVVGGKKVGSVGNEYYAAGAEATWKFLVDVNAGLDFRYEKLQILYGGRTNATLFRPWIRAGVGMNLPLPILKPFVRLEAAMPVTKKDDKNNWDQFTKATAPEFQLGLYGGIRF